LKTLAAALVWAASAISALANCDPDSLHLRGDWGTARFTTEIAITSAELSKGLMNRPSMPMLAGMLFVYKKEGPVHFWMRNTLIPLDMLFLTSDGVVQKIHENAVPLDETLIPGGNNVRYVFEINGGMAKRLGISIGTELRHPSIDQTLAAWPCE